MLRNPNSRLALAIPTYNRSAILYENLKEMLPEIREHSIPIYISDDSKDSETESMVAKLKDEYEFIFYRRNDPSLGHDRNFFATLAMPDSDYVWYLGDSLYLRPGALTDVLARANQGHDFIFINSYAKDPVDRAIEGKDVKDFLVDRGWYLTLSGATVYGRGPRSLPVAEERRVQWTNFPQLGLIFEYASLRPTSCAWLGQPSICFNRKKKSYWLKTALRVFVRDWAALVRSFPRLFTESEQNHVIRSHGLNTGLFGFKSLIALHAVGGISLPELKQLGADFALASPISPHWAKLMCLTPRVLIKSVWSAGKAVNTALAGLRAASGQI
ncbi:glycosyltransferase family 2 protein [Massilia sp. UBA6681]|uniref:glycosyltransferase family 2 protein n=1 Tax=Massilia sp. UBA6681 TaxID=1946839 RepID=UPI0025BE9990|nr:glycosyltransferase family 2 protein [Massilia sp. UBA6681]